MKRLTSSLAAALVLCALTLSAPATPAKDTWLKVRSKNFLLVGNASEKEIRQVATRLEQFRDVFLKLRPGVAAHPLMLPTTVVVFKSHSSYRPFKPLYEGKPQEHVAGYFQPGEDVNYITLTPESHGLESPFGTIFHEYTHLLVNNVLRDPPVWFNEGLAEYYSTLAVTDGNKKITLGIPISNHVLLLRQQFIHLEDLLRVTHDSPAYNEGDKTGIFYAESWALVHYLLEGNKGQRVSQLARFSELLGSGQTLEDSFRQAFAMDFATMEKELRRYVQNDQYHVQYFTTEQPLEFDAEMQTAPLSDAEAQAYLGDLLYHTNRADEAEKYLQQALTLAPDLAPAQATLGMVRVRQRRYDEAVQSLQQAVKADAQNYLAHYYLAEALSRKSLGPDNMIMRYETATAATMRAELKQAIQLNPNFPEAYHLLGFLDMVNEEELGEATGLLLRARQLKPERFQYAITLAKVYMRREQFDAARNVLNQIIRSSSADGQMRAEARATLQTVDNFAAQLARIKALNEEAKAAGARPALKRRGDDSAAQADEPPSPVDLRPRIPKRTEGQQVRGLLTKIECTGGASAVLYVQAGDKLYKLHSDAFDRVEFVTYVPQMSGHIGCGPAKPETYVIATFRPPAPEARAKFDGEVLAVDFITKEMEVEP
ncbi:MAG TPA: tetratricopeptide repeat protein [Pyrinomonadaceae bacterium]|jgi:tetratricopeptide (TPR) repeat protein